MSEFQTPRKHERLPFSRPLEVRRIGQLSWTAGLACDVSIAGLAFSTDLPLHVGDEVRIALPHSDDPRPLPATVRHVRAAGPRYLIGVEYAPTAR